MTAAIPLVHHDESACDLVVLTVYARGDVAVVGRVLQGFTVRRFVIERFVVDFSGFDHREVKGLEVVTGKVLRMTISSASARCSTGSWTSTRSSVRHLPRLSLHRLRDRPVVAW